MKKAFSRWVWVDGVVPGPDHLDPRNADRGVASRLIAFQVRNRRVPSRSFYGASRRCGPGHHHQSLAFSMIRPAVEAGNKPCQRRSSIVEVNLRISAGLESILAGHFVDSPRYEICHGETYSGNIMQNTNLGPGWEIRLHDASDAQPNYITIQVYRNTGQGRAGEREFLSHSDQPCPLGLLFFFDRQEKNHAARRAAQKFVRETQSKQGLKAGSPG